MIDLEKLKKEEIRACRIDFYTTRGLDTSYYETYYNEDKTQEMKKHITVKSELYGTINQIKWEKYNGVCYQDEQVGACYTDFDDDFGIFWDTEKLFETEQEAIATFMEKNKSDYILYDEKYKHLYTISTFFKGNTLEQINDFIKINNENGHLIKMLQKESESNG